MNDNSKKKRAAKGATKAMVAATSPMKHPAMSRRPPRADVHASGATPSTSANSTSSSSGDVALVIAKDERGTHILRRRSEDGPIEQGVLQPLAEGKPIGGEVVTLRQRPEFPLLFDVKSELASPLARLTSDGPAQVASDAYRRGWDAVWGLPPATSLN